MAPMHERSTRQNRHPRALSKIQRHSSTEQ